MPGTASCGRFLRGPPVSSSVEIVIASRDRGVVVARHWIGGNGTVERLREVLDRPPDHAGLGFESWGEVKPDQALAINEARYADGPDPQTIRDWARRYPFAEYMWCLTRDY